MNKRTKITIEYPIRSPKRILYTLVSTTNGLSNWFADSVSSPEKNIFTFHWSGQTQSAKIIDRKTNSHIKFQWLDDENEEYYFEFRITRTQLSGDMALIISDHVEPDEADEAQNLWDKQVNELKLQLGVA